MKITEEERLNRYVAAMIRLGRPVLKSPVMVMKCRAAGIPVIRLTLDFNHSQAVNGN